MSLGTSNRDGGKTSESGHLRALAKAVNGDVLEGLAVSQRGAGANMSVDVAVGDAFLRRSDGSYAHPVFNDAVYNQVISAADGSNPRRDLIVLYLDYGVTPSTAVSNNTNNVVKIKVVNGTPAGSPVDPNAAAVQASVGAGNPYTILARVRVPAGQTSITNSLIDDLRTLITNKANTVNTAAIQDNAVTNAKLATGSVTGVKILNYKYNAQEDTTNSVQNTVVLQGGWGQFLGNNTAGISKTVTFPVAVTRVLSIRINLIGYKSSAGPATAITDFNTSIGQPFNVAPYAITTTGFTAWFSGSANFGPAYHGFSWEIVAVQ